MSQGLYTHTTRAIGTILTAAIYNADHQNHITNLNPLKSGGYSDNIAQMQAQTNPGDIGAENPAPNLAGELERLRYAIARIIGLPFWYEAAQTTLADLSEGIFPNPIVVETLVEPALTLRNPVNDTTEKTMLQMERGSGAGVDAAFRAKGDGINGVAQLALYLGPTEVDRWPRAVVVPSSPTPQGYLSAHAVTPFLQADVVAGTSIYYHHTRGAWIPYFSGGLLLSKTFSNAMQLTLNAAHLANVLYDVFMWDDNGTLRIVTGPGWSNSGGGTGARGAGAGTAELTRIQGMPVNNVAQTVRNGASTFSMPAQVGIYLGTLWIDATAGQVTCHTSYGQSRKWGVWNYFNRRPLLVKGGDPSAGGWSYGGGLRPSNNNANNHVGILHGLAEENTRVMFFQQTSQNIGSGGGIARNSIGWNSTTVSSGYKGVVAAATGNVDSSGPAALFDQIPVLGMHKAQALEENVSLSGIGWGGSEPNFMLTAAWNG